MNVSVIIPTFNRIDLIERAIKSVVTQSISVSELIVIDDGSTDETASLVANKYPEVALITQPNLGVSAARNVGINFASGDWIAMLDSDDEWLPNKLEKQVLALKTSDDHFSHTDEIWIRNGVRVNAMKKHRKPAGWIFEQSLPLCCVSPSSALIHRSVFEQVGLFDESLPACEDYDLWLRIFSRFRATLVAEPLLQKYGGHQDQLSQKHWGMDRFRIRALVKILKEGHLSYSQQQAALSVLSTKIGIMIKGLKKRGKKKEVVEYQAILHSMIALYGPITE